MTEKARTIRMCGEHEFRDEAEAMLALPGDAALVRRGVLRSLAMKCPDGCGETLFVNLDSRMEKAWRIDTRNSELTLFPSVWRDSGCKSHFVVWRSSIIWCDWLDHDNVHMSWDPGLELELLKHLPPGELVHVVDLADAMDELIWDVLHAAQHLVRQGRLASGGRARADWFGLI